MLLPILIATFIDLGSCAEKLPNIDYIGLGYDIVFGNPHNDDKDPGFQNNVFELSYDTQTLSKDGRFLVPDDIQALQINTCSYQAKSESVIGATSYQKSLAVDAKVTGTAWKVMFSASAGFQEVKEGTEGQEKVYVETVAKCLKYEASVKRNLKLSKEMIQSLNELPEEGSEAASEEYFNFITDFGTHFVNQVSMGSKAILRSQFDKLAWTQMIDSKIDVQVGASLSLFGTTNANTNVQKQYKEQFESMRTSKYEAYLGSKPSSDGKWETWSRESGSDPYPVIYTLTPLLDVLNVKYIKQLNMTANTLQKKKSLLQKAYNEYCGKIEQCGEPGPDRAVVKMDLVETTIRGRQEVSCRPGFSLLSCGMANYEMKDAEVFRYSYPKSSTSCACYDYYGAVCVPWCTNAVKGFSIQTSPKMKGDFTVSCPSNSKVLGCHIESSQDGVESWRAHYPDTDGKTCHCYDHFGATCTASCAENIVDFEVRSEHRKGVVIVSCSNSNYVLGCGINPSPRQGASEQFREVKVKSSNSCQCYDYYGATCYAICGKFKTS